MNKKADIAVTILVVGVIALCVLALLSFHLSNKKVKSEGFNSVFYSQRVYDLAEAVKFSGKDLVDEYDGENVNVDYLGGKFVIEKEFYTINKWYKIDKGEEAILKIKYRFSP